VLSSFSEMHLAMIFIMMAMHQLMRLYQTESKDGQVFDIIVWVSIASLFYFPSILFIAFCLLGFALFNSIRKQHLFLIIIASSMPYLFLLAILYLMDMPTFLQNKTNLSLGFNFTFFKQLDPLIWVNFILCILLINISGFYFFYHYFVSLIHIRKLMNLLIAFSINALFIVIFVSTNASQSFLFFLYPTAIFLANFIYTEYKKIWVELLAGAMFFWVIINAISL
jgi:hypothetical protein